MKPAQLSPWSMALAATLHVTGVSAQGATDSEPAAAEPAPPPSPQAAEAAPTDLPPPPPPRGSPPPPRGKLVISAPPVPPAMLRAGYHVHDGFYLRLGAGIGAGHVSVSSDSSVASDFKVGGAGLSLNVWLGGTPWRGVALGGMLQVQGVNDSNVHVGGVNSHESMNGGLLYVGPFIDAFPDPLRGLHVGGSLGLAAFSEQGEGTSLEQVRRVKDYDGGGFGGSAWVGYMGWVGPEWSMGGMLQLTALRVRQDQDDVSRVGSGYTVSLTFNALYH